MSGAVFLRQTVYTLILYADVFQGNCGSTVFKSYVYIYIYIFLTYQLFYRHICVPGVRI